MDPDDYLDYDDAPRPKKLVSGRAAVFTMLLTGLCTIVLIVGGFLFATHFKRDIGLTLVSFSDRFNACQSNQFSYGTMLGLEPVSYSDAEMTFTKDDLQALSRGETVRKFDGMVNIRADVRFGKLVTMDISVDPAINDTTSGPGAYMMLVGNVLAGLYPQQISNSDQCFMLAYTVISYAKPVPDVAEDMYCYQIGDFGVFMDHKAIKNSGVLTDLTLHIENVEPYYLDTSKVDLSWMPWNKAGRTDGQTEDASSDIAPVNVSDSDVYEGEQDSLDDTDEEGVVYNPDDADAASEEEGIVYNPDGAGDTGEEEGVVYNPDGTGSQSGEEGYVG